jgi:putative ABC transport system permease protein
MINSETIRYSLRNLKHQKGRSFLTVFSILVGIATIFIFLSFGMGLYNYTKFISVSGAMDKVIIMPKGLAGATGSSTIIFNDTDLNAIKSSAGVLEASGIYMTAAQVTKSDQSKYAYLISYDPSSSLILQSFNAQLEKGRLLQPGDTRSVILGYNYMVDGKIFSKGLNVNDQIKINGTLLKVVGFLAPIGNPGDDSNIYITNSYFKTMYPNKNSYAEIVARVDIKNIDQAISNVERSLRHERNETKGEEDFYVQSFQSLVDSYSSTLNIIIGFVVLIALISVLVSGINTANTMITSVLERFKEIGVLKSIGARNSEIFGIFLFESASLGFIAGVLGVLLGFVATEIAKNILAGLGWSFLAPYYTPWLFIGCILFAVITGAISGVIPAIKASRINPVDSLRYE